MWHNFYLGIKAKNYWLYFFAQYHNYRDNVNQKREKKQKNELLYFRSQLGLR